jgi:hypothetical protein
VILAALQNGDQPLSPALDTLVGSGSDQILAKLTPDGSTITWATYVGGRGAEGLVMLVEIDAQGNPVVLTSTASSERVLTQNPTTKVALTTEPIAENGFDTEIALDGVLSATFDFYVAKYALNGPMIWSTYIGASGGESLEAGSLYLGANQIVVAGQTTSADFTTLGGTPFDPTYNGGTGSNADASALDATTYYGGAFGEGCTSVAVDGSGRVIVAGGTGSPDLPLAAGPQSRTRPGSFSPFLAVFSPDLSTLLYGGYFGGPGIGVANALQLRGHTASSVQVVFGGLAEDGYPLSSAPARGTVTSPPPHGMLTDATLGF